MDLSAEHEAEINSQCFSVGEPTSPHSVFKRNQGCNGHGVQLKEDGRGLGRDSFS